MWVLAYSDIYLLRRLLPAGEALGEVGLYQYAHEICLLLVLPITSLNLAWPQFLFANHSKPEAPQVFARIHMYFSFFLIEMALLLSIFSDKIIRYVGSLEYIASSRVIPYLAGSLVFYGFSILFSSGLYVAGKTRVLALVVTVCAAVNVGLNLMLIPPLGKEGAAAATLVTNALMAVLVLWFSQHNYRIPFRLGRAALGVLLSAGVVTGLVLFSGAMASVALPLRIAGWFGGSIALFAVFGMTPDHLRAGWDTVLSIFKRG
jgi:O-antigen/teichoic acid export membrane protein